MIHRFLDGSAVDPACVTRVKLLLDDEYEPRIVYEHTVSGPHVVRCITNTAAKAEAERLIAAMESARVDRLPPGVVTELVKALEMALMETNWTSTVARLPTESTVVLTKIDDAKGCRNEQTLMRQGRLWFYPDGSMYVYYTPTHWRPLPPSGA